MLSETDKGWFAGILDFQGHIVRKSNKQRARGSVQLTLYVETRHEQIISRLCALTGTSVEAHEVSSLREEWVRRGCGEHCPEAHIHIAAVNMPSMYRWTATGVTLAVVVWNLRELLRTTDEPWDWAMATCLGQARTAGQGSGAVLAALSRMRGLGWEMPPLFEQALATRAARAETGTTEVSA